jgi:hypothetical protein
VSVSRDQLRAAFAAGIANGDTPDGQRHTDEAPPPRTDADDPGTDDTAPRRLSLPDEFWSRSQHQTVRNAAHLVGVSPESLMLGVLAMVATHIPPAVKLQGKRPGVPNILVAVVGEPGSGKGTVLDRSLELVSPPPGTVTGAFGTPQGLVKAFHRDPSDHKPWECHTHAVILRADEVSAFAAATGTNTTRGDGMISHLKSAVSGERLGGGYADTHTHTHKNLSCDRLSYRLVGVVGAAPRKAPRLFADRGGGLPERVLFAHVVGDDDTPADDPGEFDPSAAPPDDARRLTPDQLTPIDWRKPAHADGRQWFSTAPSILDWLDRWTEHRRRFGGPDLDAQYPLLRHQLAAIVAYFDGSWDVRPDDFWYAGHLIEASQASRQRLLATINEVAADEDRRRNARAAAAEVVKARHVDDYRDERWVLDAAKEIRLEVAETPGVTVGELRRKKKYEKRDLWDKVLAKVIDAGHVHEVTETGQGTPKRALYPGPGSPA